MFDNILNRLSSKEKELLISIRYFSLKEEISGRKKLMKLMFFLEHFDFNQEKLTSKHQFCKNEFLIYKYGPFSFDVMNNLEKLKKEGYITEEGRGYPEPITIKLTDKGLKEIDKHKPLNEEFENQLLKVRRRFSGKSGFELEGMSLSMLHITKEDKDEFLGLPITVLLSEKKINYLDCLL